MKMFHGKPIITYSIETALKSGIFDVVMVSTDSPKIKKLSLDCGAEVPFLRSEENSGDHAGLVEVLIEVLDNYKLNFNVVCCLLPTAPMILPERLLEADWRMSEDALDAVITVQEYTYPIERSLYLKDGKIHMKWPENYRKRSQDLGPTYHDAGQFYMIRTKVLRSERNLFPPNCGAIILNQLEAQDIDTLLDWTLAEMKYKQLFGL